MSKLTLAYDVLNAVIWLPTGSQRLRSQFVEELQLPSGSRALELGCGTGQVTKALVAQGASVVAVDRSSTMLERARRRAPTATFVKADVVDADIDGAFDVVVVAFVLHELADEASRVSALSHASAHLRAAWRRVIGVIEPNGATDVLDEYLPGEIATAGLAVTHERPLAGGRASMIVAVRR